MSGLDNARTRHQFLEPCRNRICSVRIQQIALVENDNLRLFGQEWIILLEFFVDGIEIANGVVRGPIHDMQENLASLHVSQKGRSKTGSLCSTFNQSRNVTEDQASTW